MCVCACVCVCVRVCVCVCVCVCECNVVKCYLEFLHCDNVVITMLSQPKTNVVTTLSLISFLYIVIIIISTMAK